MKGCSSLSLDDFLTKPCHGFAIDRAPHVSLLCFMLQLRPEYVFTEFFQRRHLGKE